VPCTTLRWPSHQLLSACKYTVSYCIVIKLFLAWHWNERGTSYLGCRCAGSTRRVGARGRCSTVNLWTRSTGWRLPRQHLGPEATHWLTYTLGKEELFTQLQVCPTLSCTHTHTADLHSQYFYLTKKKPEKHSRHHLVTSHAHHRCGLLQHMSHAAQICVCVCLPLCWSHGCALQKRLSRSRCHMGAESEIRWIHLQLRGITSWRCSHSPNCFGHLFKLTSN